MHSKYINFFSVKGNSSKNELTVWGVSVNKPLYSVICVFIRRINVVEVRCNPNVSFEEIFDQELSCNLLLRQFRKGVIVMKYYQIPVTTFLLSDNEQVKPGDSHSGEESIP